MALLKCVNISEKIKHFANVRDILETIFHQCRQVDLYYDLFVGVRHISQ